MSQLTTLLLIALSGVAFSRIVTEPGEILSFYRKFLDKIKYDWIYKPLGGCSKCFTGQLAFWLYLYLYDYNLVYHLLFTLSAITIAYIVDLTLNLIEP